MATPPSSALSNNDRRIRVLIVDDDNDVATSLKILLEDENYPKVDEEKQEQGNAIDRNTHSISVSNKEFEVDVFNDPELALFNFKSGLYDLLLLDIVMPKMDGF